MAANSVQAFMVSRLNIAKLKVKNHSAVLATLLCVTLEVVSKNDKLHYTKVESDSLLNPINPAIVLFVLS